MPRKQAKVSLQKRDSILAPKSKRRDLGFVGKKQKNASKVDNHPSEILSAKRTVVSGTPDYRSISTPCVERQNVTMRMHCRRLTRLTNAFSKKLENFKAAVALNFAYNNLVRVHKSSA